MRRLHSELLLFLLTVIGLYAVMKYCEMVTSTEIQKLNVREGHMNFSQSKELVTQIQQESGSPCYRNVFQNHVIVMNFNYPNYDKNDILRDLYKGVFGVILTCGPRQKNPLKKGPDIWFDDGNWFSYRYLCLTLAMEKYPGYSGYFYSNDDLIVNWWNLVKFNTSNIWEGSFVDWRQQAYQPVIEKQWMWWETKHGIKACQQYYTTLQNLSQSDSFFQKAYNTYMRNSNGEAHCSKGWSDMFYIPGRLRTEYIHISKIARSSNLILEIAVGNIVRSIDDMDNMEQLKGLYLPDLGLGRESNRANVFWKIYNLNMTFIHPVKFNNNDSILTISLFKNFVLPYSNLLTLC